MLTMGVVLAVQLVWGAAPEGEFPVNPCDDAAAWKGGRGEAAIVREGEGAVRWVPAENLGLRTDDVPADWSSGNCLQWWMHSNAATNSKVWLIIYSQNDAKEGIDYYNLMVRIDWEGWRQFRIPFAAFSQVRSPIGWDKIDGLALHASWDRKAQPSPEDALILDAIRVIKLSDTGPRMTDAEFFASLDLSGPELEQVRRAVEAEDYEQAKAAFHRYFMGRRDVRWFQNWWERPEPTAGVNTSRADEALDHVYRFDGERYQLGDDIDWSSNQRDEGEAATVEWNAHLNRFPFFGDLAQAYWQTGEDKYAAEIRDMMLDWIEDSPLLIYRSGNHPYHYAWETLNTACRAGGSWIEAIWRTADSEAWTPDALCTGVKSLMEHARHLLKWPSRGNWLTAESKALTIVGTLLPECEEADNWRKVGIERLYEQMHDEIYPDGIENELALGYGMWVLRNYANIYDLMQLNGREDEIPADYKGLLERMYDYVLYAMGPDGNVPGLNDSGNVRASSVLAKGAEYFPQREDFAWGATGGKEGRPPEQTSRAFQYSGHYAMRSGWQSDARFLFLDAGPFGSGHQHEDKLTFVMQAHGRWWIVDGGNYMYDHSRWRRYVLSTRAHNTVRVDGHDQNRRAVRDTWVLQKPFEPLDNEWISGDGLDYVCGAYESGYGPDGEIRARHQRQVLFVKPDYWVIFDVLQPDDAKMHEYETVFHINADGAEAEGRRVHAEADGRRLDIIGVGEGLRAEIVKGVDEEPVQGWANYPWRPVPTALFCRTAKGPVCNAYVVYPSAWVDRAPSVTPLSMGSGGLAFTVETPSGERHYFARREGVGEATAIGPIVTDAEVCVVKVDEGGTVIGAHAFGGTTVEYEGKHIQTGD